VCDQRAKVNYPYALTTRVVLTDACAPARAGQSVLCYPMRMRSHVQIDLYYDVQRMCGSTRIVVADARAVLL